MSLFKPQIVFLKSFFLTVTRSRIEEFLFYKDDAWNYQQNVRIRKPEILVLKLCSFLNNQINIKVKTTQNQEGLTEN